jgi:gliding motility-associated-like protein
MRLLRKFPFQYTAAINQKSIFINCFRIIVLLSFLFSPTLSKATHISGADLSYRWVSGNTFEINLTLFRDCSGIAAPNSVTVNYKSASCGQNSNVSLNKVSGTGNEITESCSTATTTCNGGTNPGIQKYEYTGTITLPAQCSDWIFSYSVCCRNCAITTLSYTPNNCSGVPATYVEATLNNLSFPTNSSPEFTNPPLSFLCLGQTFHYNHGAYEIDGDSLVYSLINPRSAQNTDVVFNTGYSATNPISSAPAMTIDNETGDMIMSPTAIEVGVMAILIKEYHNGVLVGTVVRDMEVWTQGCSNLLPTATGINGTNNFTLNACPGVPLNFTINSGDNDALQNVTMSWNSGIPAASFNVGGGTRPVGTFNWTPSSSDARDQPYTFTVTVKDDACPLRGFQTYSYSIYVSDFSVNITGANSNCGAPVTGQANVTATGNGPFHYLWSNGNTTNSITNLSPGTYSVSVSNANGCVLNPSVTISAPGVLNGTMSGISPVTCFGLNNGSASVTASGGVGPYVYSWSPSGGNAATASNLSPGIYTVTITDSKGCTKTASTTITQPAALTATATGSALNCFAQNNGSASVTPSGGTSPYTYAWSVGATTSSLNSLSAGSYSVVVTDSRGCTVSKTISVTQPAPMSFFVTTQKSTCGLQNGGATITAFGGTSPYHYNWSPGGQSTNSISNVYSGNYTVTVTDNNGCTISSNVGIANISGPSLNLTTLSQVSCNGLSNGSATVNPVGGTGPFNYSWSPSGGSSAMGTNLSAGAYLVTVTDANNCIATLNVNISQPPPVTLSAIANDITCNSMNNGSVSITTSGGTPAYSYLWNGGYPNVSTISNLAPGNYSVVVSDSKGCKDSTSVTLTEPAQLTASVASISDVSCFGGNNGNATISTAGGTLPYLFNWSPGSYTVPNVSGLSANIYNVHITDGNNCTIDVPLTINEPPLLTVVIDSLQNVACNGDHNGSMHASISGGTPFFTYLWNPGGNNTSSMSNLAAALYSITVTDHNGCTSTASMTVSQPSPLTANAIHILNVSCNGGSDGGATIDASGGTTPYSYQWNTGGYTTNAVNTLTAGSYQVVVTDANGCSVTVNFSITQPAVLAASVTSTNALCNGSSNGTAHVTVTGGSFPFTYVWNSPLSNTDTIAGLNAGNYSVQITDAHNCVTSANTVITEPPVLIVNTTTVTANCGKSNGIATALVSGGTGAYKYLWSNTATTASIGGIPAGGYTVVVTDANGCSDTKTASVSNLAAPTVSVASTTNVTCPGGNDGAGTISASGGASPYTYKWNPSNDTTLTAAGLTAGTYTVKVTDKQNCVGVNTVVISEPPSFVSNFVTTAVLCTGGTNGGAVVTTTGGTGALTYQWNNGITGNSISTVSAGLYSVTITDQSNCVSTSSVTVSEPPPLIASITNTVPVSCNGDSNASAQINSNGGTPPYTYSWNEFSNNTSLATGLGAGNYSAVTTDANGCSTLSAITIADPPVIVSHVTVTPGICDQPNGVAIAVVTGGTPPYSYYWQETGGITQSINGLSPGNYSVTAYDINGCHSSSSGMVTNTGLLNVSLVSTTDVSCLGGSDGQAVVTATDGTPPYTYLWSNSGHTSNQETGLTIGTFNVVVSDSNHCAVTLPVSISEPPLLSSSVAVTHVTCFAAGNGSAIVNATGGTGPYTYDWQPGGSNANSIASLSGGAYSVKVTDMKGCSNNIQFNVLEPTPLLALTSTTPAGCMLSNGSATVDASGGTPPYQYDWSSGQTHSFTFSGIPAGSYSIIVKDANNCSVTSQASVSNTTGPSVALGTTSSTSCHGGADGVATVVVTNGVNPFTYNWFPNGGNALTAANLSAGVYSFTVRDSNNCYGSMNVVVSEPDDISSSFSKQAVSCFGGGDGTIEANITGGTAPYTYQWSNGDNTYKADSLASGTFALTVIDSLGCSQQFSVDMIQATDVTISMQSTPVNCFGGNDGIATVTPSGGSGVYSYLWSDGSTSQSITNLFTGTLTVTVTDSHGCTEQDSVTVNQPTQLISTSSSTDVHCSGGNDGGAAVNVSGGTAPYNYHWLPYGGNIAQAVNLSADTYTVNVRDDNGCAIQLSIPVNSPAALVLTHVTDSAKCFGGATGTASINVSGGVLPYQYYWTTGDTNSSVTQLYAGNYTVAVTDSNGCLSQHSVYIAEPAELLVTISTPSILCIGQQASLTADATGGIPPYSYKWDHGDSTKQFVASPALTTSYSAKVIDSNGCISLPGEVTVKVNPPLSADVATPDTICEGSNVSLFVNSTGGNGGPYNYVWSNGDTGNAVTVNPSATRIYKVSVTDQCGTPADTADVIVNVFPKLSVDFNQDVYSGCRPLKVWFHDGSNQSGKDYDWNFGDGYTGGSKDPIHEFTEAGIYNVNLAMTTYSGCSAQRLRSATVKVYELPEAVFNSDPETATLVLPQISFYDHSINAVQWKWDFADNTAGSTEQNPVHAFNDTGTYHVRLISVTDKGCADTTYKEIKIKNEFGIYIPNAFTPNSDNVNDVFSPLGLGINEFEMLIYNRWGVCVFVSNNMSIGWNGVDQKSSTECMADVYVYKISVTDVQGKSHEYSGRVSLVR